MEQCSICLEGLDNGVTLACGHRFHADCLAQMASAVGTAATRRGALTACPNCRAVSRVALVPTPVVATVTFTVGDRVMAMWGHKFYPGVIDGLIDGGRAYEIIWDDGDEGDVLAAHVRAAARTSARSPPQRPEAAPAVAPVRPAARRLPIAPAALPPPAPAPLPPATRSHVASTASAWVAACTDLLEAAKTLREGGRTKDRPNMKGLRAPLMSRGFFCGAYQRNGTVFSVEMPPDFPCYYDLVGKDYTSPQNYAQSLTTLRKYLEGALALAQTGGAYRTEAEYKPRARRKPVRAPKTSRFTGVARDGEKWRAEIGVRGSQVGLGYFDDEEDAARAYDAAVVKYRNAPTVNFPGETPLASVLAALPELDDPAQHRPTTMFGEYDAIVAAAAADTAVPRQERSLARRRVEPPAPVPPDLEAPPPPIEQPEQRAVLFPELVGRGPPAETAPPRDQAQTEQRAPAEARNAFDQTCIDLRLESAPEALRAAMVRGRVAANAFDPSLLSGFPFQGSGGRAAPVPGDAVPPPPPRPRLDVPAPASRGAQSLAAHNTPGPAWAPPASARRGRPPGPRRDRSAVVAPDPERAPTDTSSKYWGVSWHKSSGRWEAKYTKANGKSRTIGYYDTQEEAARAYDAAIRTLPPDVQLRRKMNSADANGPLVPRVRKTWKKRDREEPAAPPTAPPQKRVSAPPPRERDGLDLDRTADYLL